MNHTFGGRQPFSRGVLNAGMPKKRPEDSASLYPANFKAKVDQKKVKMEAIQRWVPRRVVHLLGYEDEVIVSYIHEMLAGSVCPRLLQINLTGFLAEKAPVLAKEIWDLMLDGQAQPDGVPTILKKIENAEASQASEAPVTEENLKQRMQEFSKELGDRVDSGNLASRSPSRDKHPEHRHSRDRKHRRRDKRRDRRDRRDRDRDRRRSPRRRRSSSPRRHRRRSRSSRRSRSPPIRKPRSRSPRRRGRSRSPRKDRSGSPPPRKDRSGSPPPRKDRSGSPRPRKDPSGSPTPRKDRSGSPPPRKDRSKSPLSGSSGSKSPPRRAGRSQS